MSWYNQGFDHAKKENEKMEDRINGLGTLRRLWIPAGESKQLVFLDDQPFLIYEHQAKIDGDFRNWFTCLRGIEDECPACEQLGVKSRYFVGYFTVINCSEYIDKKGNKHQFEVQLLAAKSKSLKMLEMRSKAKGGLAGKLWNANRTDKKTAVCGDVYDYEKDADLSKLFHHANINGKKLSELIAKANTDEKELARLARYLQLKIENGKALPQLTPVNYMEQVKPLGVTELKYAIKGAEVDGDEAFGGNSAFGGSNSGGGSSNSGSGSDEVPF